MATVKTVPVSDHVKEQLDLIKEAEQHTSYDSAMRSLLNNYDIEYANNE